MMVEAGGTQKSFAYYAEGAPKVDEGVLASGLDACKVWIKESIALQRQLLASVIATDGPITPLEFTPVVDYSDDVFAAVERVASERLAGPITISLPSRVKVIPSGETSAAVASCVESKMVVMPRSGDQTVSSRR